MEKEWYHPMVDALVENKFIPIIVLGINSETGIPRLSMSLELPKILQEFPDILETIILSVQHLRELVKPPDDRAKGITLSLYKGEI